MAIKYSKVIGIISTFIISTIMIDVVRSVSDSQPTSVPALNPEILRAEVAKYVQAADRKDTSPKDFLDYYELRERLGGRIYSKEISAECYRQATEGNRDLVLAKLLRYENSELSFVKDIALANMNSSIPQLQREAVMWCVRHSGMITTKERDEAGRIVRQWKPHTKVWNIPATSPIKNSSQPSTMDANENILVKAVADEYINQVESYPNLRKAPPDFVDICERVGISILFKKVKAECFRQAIDGKHELAFAELIASGDGEPYEKEVAILGLSSENPKIWKASIRWCNLHSEMIDEKTKALVRQVVLKWISATENNEDRYDAARYILRYAIEEDIPLVQKIMEDFKNEFDDPEKKYAFEDICLGTGLHYSDFSAFLCRYGDIKALHEIADLLTQTEDMKKRTWALMMAVKLKPKGFFASAVADALSDQTVLPTPVSAGPPPGVTTQVAMMTSLLSYTRICDMAARVVAEIEPSKTPWPFEVPPLSDAGWGMDTRFNKDMKEIADDGSQRTMSGSITFRRIIGLSNDNIKWTADYAKKCQEDRLKQAQAGAGPRISLIGVEDKLLKALANDFIRASKPVQLTQKAESSDASSLTAFVGEKPPDFMILPNKPGEQAMKIHGQKWNGLNPAEYVLAGRSIAIIVNSINQLDSLTLDQVRDVFTGTTSDWNVLGKDLVPAGTGDVSSSVFIKPDKPSADARRGIILYGLASPTPVAPGNVPDPYFALFTRAIGQSKLAAYQAKKDSAETIAAVAMDPAAIAFVDASQLVTATGKAIKVLAIGEPGKSVLPQARAILDGSYLLSTRLYLYIHPKASTTAKDFTAFITSSLCIESYMKNGLIPLSDTAIARAKDVTTKIPATQSITPTKPVKDRPHKPPQSTDTQPARPGPAKPDLPVWK